MTAEQQPPPDLVAQIHRHHNELDAIIRAYTYAGLDPVYEGKPISRREEKLMRLAIRAYAEPGLVETAITRLRQPTSKEKNDDQA